MVFKRVGHRTD